MLRVVPNLPCNTFAVVVCAFLGCMGYRTPMNTPPAGTPPADASVRDVRPDLAADLRRDLAADSSPDRGPDMSRDLTAAHPPDLAPDLPRNDTRVFTGCTPGDPYILVLGADEVLYRFAPETMTLTRIASVSCGSQSLNSLTVSPLGPAYISSHSGQLCVVDLATFTAAATSFDPSVIQNSRYGMALLPDNVPAGQTLYIVTNTSSGQANNLSHIDLSSFTLTTVGPIKPTLPAIELTAGPNGELYAFSPGAVTSQLLTIDPGTAMAIDVTDVPAGYSHPSFALVNWQGDFYLFLGDGNITVGNANVFRYHKGDTQVTLMGGLDQTIIGAGVALCQ